MSELKTFPRTTVAGVSMPRMIAGTNWILGYSHTGGVADKMIRERHADPRATADLLAAFLEEGVDALMAPYCNNQNLIDAVKMAEEIVKPASRPQTKPLVAAAMDIPAPQ